LLSAIRHRIFTRSFRRGTVLVAVGGLLVPAALSASSGPDPASEAVADGCTRNVFDLATRRAPMWVYVGDRETPATGPPPPPRWVSGVAVAYRSPLGIHPTAIDNPFAHDSYDVIVNVRPDADGVALLGGDQAARTGNYEGEGEETARLHMEREEAGFPPSFWPENGDRIEAYGSWVWDCGHWLPGGERTEFHPIRLLWVARRPSPRSPSGENEGGIFYDEGKTPAGIEADCAHRSKGDQAAFEACLPVEQRAFSPCAWTAAKPCPATDTNCPFARESTRFGQITTSPGEWLLYADVGGIWTRLGPSPLRVRDGQRLRLGASVGVYATARRPPRVLLFARECDFGRPSFDNP
jgi:hypothetical protein